MRKITIISIFCLLTSIEVSAGIDQDQLKNSALEFVRAELSGVHIDGKDNCLSKNKYELNKIGQDIYAELDLSKIQYVDFATLQILEIKKIDKDLDLYRASFSIKTEDGKNIIRDHIKISINSKNNKEKYGFANLIQGTDNILLRSDCK